MAPLRTWAALAVASMATTAQAWHVELPPCLDPYQPFIDSGCFANTKGKTLNFRSSASSEDMTVGKCVAECKGNGYRYAGLEYYGVCYCGNTVNGAELDDSQCSFPCNGNKEESCGGDQKLSVYSDPTFPEVDVSVSDYVDTGCWSSTNNLGRVLSWPQDQLDSSEMTTESCIGACRDGGFPLAGVEYGGECYCGTVMGNGTEALDSQRCNMPCNGDESETCGGSGAVNIYHADAFQSLEPCGYDGGDQEPPYEQPSESSQYSSEPTTESSPSNSEPTGPSYPAPEPTTESSQFSSSEPTGPSYPNPEPTTESSPLSSSEPTGPSYPDPEPTTASSYPGSEPSEPSQPGPKPSEPSQPGPKPSEPSHPGPDHPGPDHPGPDHPGPDHPGPDHPGPDHPGPDHPGPDHPGPDHPGPDHPGPDHPGPDHPGPDLPGPDLPGPDPTEPPAATTTTGNDAVCTTEVVTPPKDEYCIGKWCSSPIPDFDDNVSCKKGLAKCKLQVASCLKSAGWPQAMECFNFKDWCSGIDSYCGSKCGGKNSCSKKDCFKNQPPKGGKSPTTTTTTVPCPTEPGKPNPPPVTTTTAPVPDEDENVPEPTGICVQPSNKWQGYGPGNAVGNVDLPILTCNNLKGDFKKNPFKLYTHSDSRQCKSYTRTQVPNACQEACKVQYNGCRDVYAKSRYSHGGRFWREKRDEEVEDASFNLDTSGALAERTFGFGSWKDSFSGASSKCKDQYAKCVTANKRVSIDHKCTKFGH